MNSSQLKSYLTGLVLGDGFIDKGISKRSFNMASINKDWIDKIYEDLTATTNFEIYIKEKSAYIGKDGTHHKKCWALFIKSHPYFAKKYHWFYDDYKKRIITKQSLEALDWNGWANWYMSDGYIVRVGLKSGHIYNRRVQLCTDRYSYDDVLFLTKFINKKYGYETNIISRGNTYRLNFKLDSAQKFLLNIEKFIPPSLRYKLDMCYYGSKPYWMTDEYYLLMQDVQESAKHYNA